jgi:hypothetical protein
MITNPLCNKAREHLRRARLAFLWELRNVGGALDFVRALDHQSLLYIKAADN